MRKNNNLLRIKVNGKNLIKFTRQHGGRDFLITYPTIYQNETETQNHFTFHSPNGRITLKITSVKLDGQEMLSNIILLAKDNPRFSRMILSKEIDLYKELGLLNFTSTKKIYPWGTVALNLKNSSLEKYFRKTKTLDNKFKTVRNVKIPKSGEDKITIKFGIGKNFCGNIKPMISKYDDYIKVEEFNHIGDKYIFLFLIEYKFPDT